MFARIFRDLRTADGVNAILSLLCVSFGIQMLSDIAYRRKEEIDLLNEQLDTLHNQVAEAIGCRKSGGLPVTSELAGSIARHPAGGAPIIEAAPVEDTDPLGRGVQD